MGNTTIVLDTSDQIATARLIALKGAVRLETLGMGHSSGKKMWKVARRDLGLAGNSTIDDVYGALCKEIEARSRPMVMLDTRCPKCDQPAVGVEEIVRARRLPAVNCCQHCQCALEVVPNDDMGQPDLKDRTFAFDTLTAPGRAKR